MGRWQGESSDVVWLQPPVPGHRLATPAHLGQERAQPALARDAACTAPGWGQPSWCFQESALPTPANTEAARADGAPKAIVCSPPQVSGNVVAVGIASHQAHCISGLCPPFSSSQAGLGLMVPSLPGPAALSVELSAEQPPFLLGRVHGRWMCIACGMGLREWSVPFLHAPLAVGDGVFSPCSCTEPHTNAPFALHTFFRKAEGSLGVEKAPESWQRRILARLVIYLYSGVGEVQSPVSEPLGCAGRPSW